MTNTLHRRGSPESLQKDFVVFALPKLEMFPFEELVAKLERFTQICLKNNPINVGKLEEMSIRRVDPALINEQMKGNIALTATFDNVEDVASVVSDLKAAELGISINISGLLETVHDCCQKVGQNRHSVEQSLGIFGNKERLPSQEIVEIGSLCGHGLVSFNLIRKIMDEVILERMTPTEGANYLAKPCECGVFNISRARDLLENLRNHN